MKQIEGRWGRRSAYTPLLNIRPKMIREFRDKRTNDGMAPQTI